MSANRSLAVLAAASVLSGAAALVFQTVWTRAFAIILGSTVQAAAVTFSAFLCGLALGAHVAGALGSRLRRPFGAYAVVEVLIAVTGVAVGLVLHGNADALAAAFASNDPFAKLSLSFLGALALLAVPTFFMGATFPVIVEAWKAAGGNVRDVALVYAFNVFGAACGTIVCGYFLIRLFGITHTLQVGCALNAAAAVLVALLGAARRGAAPPGGPAAGGAPGVSGASNGALLGVVFLSGFLVLGFEIVWARLASFFLGNRIFAITTLLASILVLLALGSFAASRLRRSARFTAPELLSLGFTVAALGALLSTFGAWYWIQYHELVEAAVAPTTTLQLALRTASCFVLMAPVFLPLGVLFPLAISLAPRLEGQSSRVAGSYYLVNTVGAVIGALVVGFLGMRAVGTPYTAAALSGICALAALAFFFLARRAGPVRFRLAPALAVATIGFAFATPPRILISPHAEGVVFYREDEYGALQVIRMSNGHTRVVNNRTELVFHLGHPVTSYVQAMQGHLGMFFNPGAKTAAVLGSGYGITAGTLAAYPGLERIDAVEIVPGMLAAADLFRPFNYSYHRDPRMRLHADDGRNFIVRAGSRYDIISVNVSDPRLPGGSSLFHREFYDLVKTRLAPGGVVIQHAFGEEIGVVLATLADAFPHLRLFPSYANGFNVVASLAPLEVDAPRLAALAAETSVRRSLLDVGLFAPVSIPAFAAAGFTPADLSALFSARSIATDDRPLIEFSTSGNPFFSNQ